MGIPERKIVRHFTFGDYRNWPAEERWELISGMAWNMCAAPNLSHQGACGELFRQISNFLIGKPGRVFMAPTNLLLPDFSDQAENAVDTVVQPDIFVVFDQSKCGSNYVRGAPDWVIEILSPSTSRKDQRDKFDRYEQAGIPAYWLVNPANKCLQTFDLDPQCRTYGEPRIMLGGGYAEVPSLPGLQINLSWVFAFD